MVGTRRFFDAIMKWEWRCLLGMCRCTVYESARRVKVDEKKNHPPLNLLEVSFCCEKCGRKQVHYKVLNKVGAR